MKWVFVGSDIKLGKIKIVNDMNEIAVSQRESENYYKNNACPRVCTVVRK